MVNSTMPIIVVDLGRGTIPVSDKIIAINNPIKAILSTILLVLFSLLEVINLLPSCIFLKKVVRTTH